MGLGNDDEDDNNKVMMDDGNGGGGGNSFGSVSCSICLEIVTDNGDRSLAKLLCGHQFHLGNYNFSLNSCLCHGIRILYVFEL